MKKQASWAEIETMTRTQILDANGWNDAAEEAEYLAELKAEKERKRNR